MRRYFAILIVLAILLMAWVVSAKTDYPVGYTCTVTVYDAGHGMQPVDTQLVVIDAFVELHIIAPSSAIYGRFTVNGIPYWNFYSSETLDAICK